MNQFKSALIALLAAWGLLSISAPTSYAQVTAFSIPLLGFDGGAGDLPYDVATNWEADVIPDSIYPVGAAITTHHPVNSTNYPTGTVYLDSAVSETPGELNVSGSKFFEIRSGGSLTVVETFDEVGDLESNGLTSLTSYAPLIGAIQPGKLTILSGGTLTTQHVLIQRVGTTGTGPQLIVGDTSGGSATLDVKGVTIVEGAVNVVGKSDSFHSHRLVFNPLSTLSMVIGSTNTTLDITADVEFNGTSSTLDIDFDEAEVTPTAGDEWILYDTAGVDGTFSTVTTDFTVVEPSQGFRFFNRPGGTNGVQGVLALEQYLGITVDRGTREIQLVNNGPSAGVDIVAYSISSSAGALEPSEYVSFDNSEWVSANPTANEMSELNLYDSSTVSASSSTTLGDIFRPYPVFGTFAQEDLVFSYEKANGDVVTGQVEYTGENNVANNLVLTVNTTTGDATITNDSLFDIDFDGYSISSDDGSLTPGSLVSLEDQEGMPGISGWEEQDTPTINLVSEVNPFSTLHLDAGESFDLEGLFNPNDTEDLEFEFAMLSIGGQPAQQVIAGYIGYFAGPEGVPGDYNGNGTVDAADYALWRDHLGDTGTPGEVLGDGTTTGDILGVPDGLVDEWDYAFWRSTFGNTAGAGGGAVGAGSVPEPSSLILACLAMLGCIGVSRRTATR